MPVHKFHNPSTPAKRFYPITPTLRSLKLTERVVLRRHISSLGAPDDSRQFVHKRIRFTLDMASLIHFITRSLIASRKSVQWIFLVFSIALDSFSRSLLFRKLE